MKRLLILILAILAGCGQTEQEKQKQIKLETQKRVEVETLKRIKKQLKSSGTFTDEDAEYLSQRYSKELYHISDLTSITNSQAEILSKVESIRLDGLTSLTDEQAESLSNVSGLYLNGLTSINDEPFCDFTHLTIINSPN